MPEATRFQIFINYRRSDSAGHAGRLWDFLTTGDERFDEEQVFMDIDRIELGTNYKDAIDAAVGACDVLLAIIGRDWLKAPAEDGSPRLNDPSDFVRLELEAALRRSEVRVVPILIAGASMPNADQLPASLERLADFQAHELSDTRFRYDAARLVRALNKMVARKQERGAEERAAAQQKAEREEAARREQERLAAEAEEAERERRAAEEEAARSERQAVTDGGREEATAKPATARQRASRSSGAGGRFSNLTRNQRRGLAAFGVCVVVAVLAVVVLTSGGSQGPDTTVRIVDVGNRKEFKPDRVRVVRLDSSIRVVNDARTLVEVSTTGADWTDCEAPCRIDPGHDEVLTVTDTSSGASIKGQGQRGVVLFNVSD